jgi:S1-C subfamily serine protease
LFGRVKGLTLLSIIIASALLTISYVHFASAQEITNNATNGAIASDDRLVQLFEKVKPSVVQVTVLSKNLLSSGLGSGFVFDKSGHIITNNHVVDSASGTGIPAGNVTVTFLDGRSYKAKVVGTDQFSDLAVLQINSTNTAGFTPLPIGNSSNLKIGERVVAIGNPFGLSGSMTEGIISGLGRLLPSQTQEEPDLIPDPNSLAAPPASFSIPEIIQTDAAINPGNSGGPLLNLNGEVIGINSAIFSTTGAYSGIGFAVPANTIKKIVPILISENVYKHPWIGISGTDITPDIASAINITKPSGFLIIDITPNSPASKAGLHGGSKLVDVNGRKMKVGGDLILKIDDKNVTKIDDILTYLEENKNVGDNVALSIFRNGKEQNVSLTLEPRPNETIFQAQPWLGITGLDVTPSLSKALDVNQSNGILVIGVIADSPADKAGIRGGFKLTDINGTQIQTGGDIITRADNQTVTKVSDLSDYISLNKNVGDNVNLTILRDGKSEQIKAMLEAKPKLQIIP